MSVIYSEKIFDINCTIRSPAAHAENARTKKPMHNHMSLKS